MPVTVMSISVILKLNESIIRSEGFTIAIDALEVDGREENRAQDI